MNYLKDINTYSGFRPQIDRNFPEFRQQIYEYLVYTLSDVMTREDLDVVVKLITEIFGDLYMRTGLLPWQIDVRRCPDSDLKNLGNLIGYRWQDGLTIEEQRVGIELYCLIRRNRGTTFGLENLIRSYGQTLEQYYSSTDLRGVKVIEYGSAGPETLEPNMFPGDIKIQLPEFSSILRDSIFDTKLAGTRLFFEYLIFLGVFHMGLSFDTGYTLTITPDTNIQGYDPLPEDLGPFGLDTELGQILDFQLTHGIRGNNVNDAYEPLHKIETLNESHHGNMTAGVQILTYYKEPWQNGFILNTPGLTNYRGFLQPLDFIQPDEILYK